MKELYELILPKLPRLKAVVAFGGQAFEFFLASTVFRLISSRQYPVHILRFPITIRLLLSNEMLLLGF